MRAQRFSMWKKIFQFPRGLTQASQGAPQGRPQDPAFNSLED